MYLSFTDSTYFIIYAMASKQFEFETKYSSQNKYTSFKCETWWNSLYAALSTSCGIYFLSSCKTAQVFELQNFEVEMKFLK